MLNIEYMNIYINIFYIYEVISLINIEYLCILLFVILLCMVVVFCIYMFICGLCIINIYSLCYRFFVVNYRKSYNVVMLIFL